MAGQTPNNEPRTLATKTEDYHPGQAGMLALVRAYRRAYLPRVQKSATRHCLACNSKTIPCTRVQRGGVRLFLEPADACVIMLIELPPAVGSRQTLGVLTLKAGDELTQKLVLTLG